MGIHGLSNRPGSPGCLSSLRDPDNKLSGPPRAERFEFRDDALVIHSRDPENPTSDDSLPEPVEARDNAAAEIQDNPAIDEPAEPAQVP